MVFMLAALLLMRGFQHKRLVISIAVGVVVVGLIILASTLVIERITTLTQNESESASVFYKLFKS